VRWTLRIIAVIALIIISCRWVNPPITYLQAREWITHGTLARDWVDLEDIPQEMRLAAVAAEDVNFCTHWGIDLNAIMRVIDGQQRGGASTITQQTVKNVLLWPNRSWVRKGLELVFVPVVEIVWGKRRILELYLNVAEFDTATFGVEAGSQSYFGHGISSITPQKAARLASVLPLPRVRSARDLTEGQTIRVRNIDDGARYITNDRRSACFTDTVEDAG
jgi:monofunctional biosynthetic peptidoglycan transglycosylase